MQQTSTEKNAEKSTATKLFFDIEKYPLVEISRKFTAPVERLWKAWTEPELMKQWWGPENYSCPEAKMDVRVGGKSILAMKGPDGKLQYSGGTYEEIVPNQKIVTTDQFTDKDGNFMSAKDVGLPGEWPDTMRITIEFKSLAANETQMSIVHQGIPKEAHDDCVSGWSSSIDKLQKVVEHN
jgi:uncharacterized protein YndB with AHSA1/START domain